MAIKKVNNEIINDILLKYDGGESPANLASLYGVHPTTIRRYLRQNGRNLSKVSQAMEMDLEVKLQLRKILLEFNVNNEDIINTIDKYFIIEIKPRQDIDEAFNIINL